MIKYTPPTPDDLQRLKRELGYTGEQMAELASLAGGQQWRKYTGGAAPRDLSLHILFLMAARLALSPGELRAVVNRMRGMGAQVEPDDFALPQASDER